MDKGRTKTDGSKDKKKTDDDANDINILYVSRKEESRELACVEYSVDASIMNMITTLKRRKKD